MILPFDARRIVFTAPDGYYATNPSVTQFGDRIVVVLRTVNHTINENGEYVLSGQPYWHTRNFFLVLDECLEVQSTREILPIDIPGPRCFSVGFQDFRAFEWNKELWGVACVEEFSPQGLCKQVLARISPRSNALSECRLSDCRILHPPSHQWHEKNWTPRIANGELEFIYQYDPISILDKYGQLIRQIPSPIAATNFRGGSQMISFDGGWLTVIHTVDESNPLRRHYFHRFVWLDDTSVLRFVSEPFSFCQRPIEFATGLTWHPDNKHLIISHGVHDAEAWIVTIDADQVRRTLQYPAS